MRATAQAERRRSFVALVGIRLQAWKVIARGKFAEGERRHGRLVLY